MEKKTLDLGIKAPFLLQILRGFKTTEYREKKPYYDGLLVEEETAESKDGQQGWTRCFDGMWRKFNRWDAIRLSCSELGSAEFEVLSLNASAFHYLIRLGRLLERKEPVKKEAPR